MEEKDIPKLPGIGLDMLDLITRVRKKFSEEYNFKPSTVEITNLIAKRVNENELFS